MGQCEVKMMYSNEELRRMWYENNLKNIEVTREVVDSLFGYENDRILRGDTYDVSILEYCYEKLDEYDPKYDAEKAEQVRNRFIRQINQIADNKRQTSVPRFMVRFFVAVIIMLLSIQFVSLAMNGNFFDSVATWTKEMFCSIIGQPINCDTPYSSTYSKRYESYEALQADMSLDLDEPKMPECFIVSEIYSGSDERQRYVDIHYKNGSVLYAHVNGDELLINKNEADKCIIIDSIAYYIYIDANTIMWSNNNVYILSCSFDIRTCYREIIDCIK